MRFHKQHEDDVQEVLVTKSKIKKKYIYFAFRNIITHLCLLIVDGYAWAIDKQTMIKMRKRMNQVDMIIFYINRDFVCNEMSMNMREEENEGLTCFNNSLEKKKNRISFFSHFINRYNTGHQSHRRLSRKLQSNHFLMGL